MDDPPPGKAPEQPDETEDVEDPFPSEVFRQETGNRKRDHGADVAAGEANGRQPAPFKWWRPTSPDGVDGRVSYPLEQYLI